MNEFFCRIFFNLLWDECLHVRSAGICFGEDVNRVEVPKNFCLHPVPVQGEGIYFLSIYLRICKYFRYNTNFSDCIALEQVRMILFKSVKFFLRGTANKKKTTKITNIAFIVCFFLLLAGVFSPFLLCSCVIHFLDDLILR